MRVIIHPALPSPSTTQPQHYPAPPVIRQVRPHLRPLFVVSRSFPHRAPICSYRSAPRSSTTTWPPTSPAGIPASLIKTSPSSSGPRAHEQLISCGLSRSPSAPGRLRWRSGDQPSVRGLSRRCDGGYGRCRLAAGIPGSSGALSYLCARFRVCCVTDKIFSSISCAN